MERLRLFQWDSAQPQIGEAKLKEFIRENPNPFVSARSDDEIRSAIGDGNLFFVENEGRDIVASTALYLHDRNATWGEIGTTLVAGSHQGLGLQVAIYSHILALRSLTELPKQVFAIVDEKAGASYTNVERSGFVIGPVPASLTTLLPKRNWASISRNEKRFYSLSEQGLGQRLLYAADCGREHILSDRSGRRRVRLLVDFAYWRDERFLREVRAIGMRILEKPV